MAGVLVAVAVGVGETIANEIAFDVPPPGAGLTTVTLADPAWAVESARGLGYLLAQQLVSAGE